MYEKNEKTNEGQRRIFRDQDPPRICDYIESSKSTPSSPSILQRTTGLGKCLSESTFLTEKQHPRASDNTADNHMLFASVSGTVLLSSYRQKEANITNGLKRNLDSCNALNGQEMAPMLGVPPPPPPAPHMGPDGLILPRKPYNPCLTSTNHTDLRKELLFNQKIGKNVLNQKSELQRALERQREIVSRKEAEKIREETYKDDPRTALQRAIEQRAKHIQLMQEQSQATNEPSNKLLITARAKLRPRTDSQ